MAHSPRTLRIALASLIALLMIGGSFAFSGPDPLFGLGRIAEAQSSEELLREYAAKDSDTDGLPDWQEALYGTDPLDPESFRAGVKDGDAVAQGLVEPKVTVRSADEPTDPSTIPGTVAAANSLTDRFAQTLLKQYLENRGATPPTQEEVLGFVKSAVADLAKSTASADTYAIGDLRSSGTSGAAALRSYAEAADAAYAANTVKAEKNELYFFDDAMKGDKSALTEIRAISKAYANTAEALMELSVPAEARQAHLAIANSLMRMSSVTADMAALETDPLRALLGIGLYESTVVRMSDGFSNLGSIFAAQQVVIQPGAAGYDLYSVAKRAAQ